MNLTKINYHCPKCDNEIPIDRVLGDRVYYCYHCQSFWMYEQDGDCRDGRWYDTSTLIPLNTNENKTS